MKERIFIDCDVIYLRQLTTEDINENYVHWFDDAYICKYNSHHIFPKSYGNLVDYVNSVNSNMNQLVLAMISKDTHTHFGNIALQNIDYISKSAEISIIIGERDFMGKGYSKLSGAAVIKHGFDTINLNRIYCGTLEKNTPANNLFKSLGFICEGCRRKALYKNGTYNDILDYGLLKNEWEKEKYV